MSMFHPRQGVGEIHRWTNIEFANAAARLAATYTEEDEGKVYTQIDDGSGHRSWWELLDHTGPTFAMVASEATAAGLSSKLDTTNVDNDTTMAGDSTTKVPTQHAVRTYVNALLAANDALVLKGGIDASTNPNYPAADAGHVYKISVAGKLGGASGATVEVGDTAYCITDGSSSGTQAAVGSNWVIIPSNLDIDTDGTMAANSDGKIPSQKAVRTYVASATSGFGSGDMTLVGVQTVTGAKTFNDGKLIAAGATSGTTVIKAAAVAGTTTVTLPAANDTLVGKTTTDTLTNKRVTPRTDTVASSATPSINTDTTDLFTITALAAAITSMTTNLTGTPTEGEMLMIRIKDNGTARAITWGASFASRGATLPTTTVVSKILYVLLIWNAVASTWDCVSTAQES